MFFFTFIDIYAQRKYFVANEQDIEELSIRKIIIIDTGLFHIKGESFVTIEPEVMWIIQESKSICFIKRRYQSTSMKWFHGIQPIVSIVGYH